MYCWQFVSAINFTDIYLNALINRKITQQL